MKGLLFALAMAALLVSDTDTVGQETKKDAPKLPNARAAVKKWKEADVGSSPTELAEAAFTALTGGEEADLMSKTWRKFAAAEQELHTAADTATKEKAQKKDDDTRADRKAAVRVWEDVADEYIAVAAKSDKKVQAHVLTLVSKELTRIEALTQPSQRSDSETWGIVQAQYGHHQRLWKLEAMLTKTLEKDPIERKAPRK